MGATETEAETLHFALVCRFSVHPAIQDSFLSTMNMLDDDTKIVKFEREVVE